MKRSMVVVLGLATAFALLMGAPGQAQPPKEGDKPAAEGAGPPAIPKPAPENDVIKKSSGSWTCEGTGKTPDGKELKYKSTWTVKPALGGHWYTIVYKRSKMGPLPPFEGNATVGYNTAEKRYTLVGFDSFGSWINLRSPDGAVYTGDGGPMGKVTPVKFTFTEGKDKKGEPTDKAFDAVLDFGTASSTESCKK